LDKTLIYSVAAAMLGLALIIIPIHLALISNAQTNPLYQKTLGLKTEDRQKEEYTRFKTISEDLEILSISFFVAMGIYLSTRRRRPKRFYTWPPIAPSLNYSL
jgi:hypothetical protein